MEHWKKMTSSVGPLGQTLTERFGTLNQQARERFGNAHDITELPDEYKQLEQRVDAVKAAHTAMMRTARTYESETYDYPNHLQESFTHASQTIGHTLSSWAAAAAKNTNLGQVQATSAPENPPRTLHHALSRSAASAAIDLGASSATYPTEGGADAPTAEARLSELLQKFAVVQDKIGGARLSQDHAIVQNFILVWNAFGAQIQLAMKARQSVRDSRLHLDSWRQALKNAETGGASSKLEHYRSEVEQAEDRLVSATEEAISLMKNVLDNPEPIKSLAEFVHAQLEFHRTAVAALEPLQADMAGVATTVEAEYRASRG